MTDFSRCSVCGAQVLAGTTSYTQAIDGHLAIVTDVPVQTCRQCGEQYFTPETVDKLQRLLAGESGGRRPPTMIEVPVYPFA